MTFCTSCGSRVPEGARFCENCGTAVRQPGTAAAPAPAAAPGPFAPAPHPSAPQPAAPDAGAPAWAAPAAQAPGHKKSRRGLLTVAGGVAALGVLGGVGYVVYDQFTGPNGGAESPSAAVLELSAAAGSEDAATALSMLPPGEVGPIVDLYEDVQAKATSTGVASEEDPFAGFSLDLTDVQVQTQELSEDVAAVTVTSGTVSWALDPDQLQGPLRIDSYGETRRATSGEADLVEVTREAANGAPMRIMTVQQDGRWYVSPMYTLLEAWRTDQGLPAPDFTQELDYEGTGADSATAVVEQAAQAVAGYDVEAFLDLLSPDEAAALYQYRDAVMVALARDGELAELQYETELTVDVTVTEGDEVDDRTPVTVRSAAGTVLDDDGDYSSWSLDRNCLTVVDDDGDSEGACLDEAFAGMGVGSDLAARFPALTVLTQEVDGRWYLSPLATLVAETRDAVTAMDADDVAGVLGVPQFGGVDGELEDGVPVEGSIADTDTALYEMDVSAGQVVSFCMDSDPDAYVWAWLYGPDGRAADESAVLATDGGRYRLLVGNTTGDGGTVPFSVTPTLSTVEEVTVPATVPADGGGACGTRLLRFPATAGVPLYITVDGSIPGLITSPSGETAYGSSLFMPTETGEHVLYAQADEEVAIGPIPADMLTVGGSVTGTITSSRGTTVRVYIPANGYVSVEAYGDGRIYPEIEVENVADGSSDSDWGTLSFPAQVYVSPDVPGLYDVTVSDAYGSTGTFQLLIRQY